MLTKEETTSWIECVKIALLKGYSLKVPHTEKAVPLDMLRPNYIQGVISIHYWLYDEHKVKVARDTYEKYPFKKERLFKGVYEGEDVYTHYLYIRHNLQRMEYILYQDGQWVVDELEFVSQKGEVITLNPNNTPFVTEPLNFDTVWLLFVDLHASTRRIKRPYKVLEVANEWYTKYEDKKRKKEGLTKYKNSYKENTYSDILIRKVEQKTVTDLWYEACRVLFELHLFALTQLNVQVEQEDIQQGISQLHNGKPFFKIANEGYILILKDYWWKENRGKRRRKTYEKY